MQENKRVLKRKNIMSELLKNILRFILLIIIQVFILNHILIYDFVTPSLYLLFILLLPFNTSRWGLMFCGFLLGLCLDIFMNTQGMHAAACVLIAYLRPTIMDILTPQKGFDTIRITPSVSTMGWVPFLIYAAILTFIHHVLFFTLEIFDFHDFFYISSKILLSTVLTLAMILVYEMLFTSSKAAS